MRLRSGAFVRRAESRKLALVGALTVGAVGCGSEGTSSVPAIGAGNGGAFGGSAAMSGGDTSNLGSGGSVGAAGSFGSGGLGSSGGLPSTGGTSGDASVQQGGGSGG